MKNILRLIAIAATLLGCAAMAEAQQPKKVPRIGYFTLASKPGEQDAAFKQGLRDLGWVEGQNIIIEYRWAAGKVDRLPTLAEELVRLKVDIIVAWTGPVIQTAKKATTTIPIVMGPNADPVATGLVASLARPGGNITGVSLMSPDLVGKELELLRELLPKLSRVAFLAHGGSLGHGLLVKEAQDAAQILGMRIQPLVVGGPEEFEDAFSAMARERAGALVVQSIFVGSGGHGQRIADLAAKNRLPTVSTGSQFAEEGGLIFYGPSGAALWRRVAYFVDKILKGAKPADLPVEQPTKFELWINLKTAKQIGLTIPQSVLFRADKVIK